MILPKDIFRTTKEHIRFILYLYTEKTFTVEKLSLEFNISKWVLYKKIKIWEDARMIAILTQTGDKGGKQYRYQVTGKINTYLKDFLSILLKELD